MNWYIAKVVFNISGEHTANKKQFDEQLRLVSASGPEEAFFKARAIGLKEETTFYNDKLNKVKWEFINVSEVVPLQGLEDGTEVYSRIHEIDQPASYISVIHQKAIALRLSAMPLF